MRRIATAIVLLVLLARGAVHAQQDDRGSLAPCPDLFAQLQQRVTVCQCPAAAMSSGTVSGSLLYARTSAICRSARHAGALDDAGGLVIVHAIETDGQEQGAERHGVPSLAARFDGRAFRPMSATIGNLRWAERQSLAYGEPNRPFVAPGQAQPMVPVPMPQALGLPNETVRAALQQRPNLAEFDPPVLMPAFWRTPVRRPDQLPPLQAAPAAVAGAPIQVLSTARLVVDGRQIVLAHIEGVEGAQARGLAAFMANRGNTLTCLAVGPSAAVRCQTQDGVDLALAALFNGGARALPTAPPEYRQAEAAARQARRGIWATAP